MGVLKLKAGADNNVKFTITDDDDAVVNLTGGTIVFKIATTLSVSDDNAEYFAEYTVFTNAAAGIHIETIPDSTSGLWTPENYIFQARFITSAGLVKDEDIDICEIEGNLIDNV